MKKYIIKYTFEFLVIVMGISVSFWLNNWNTNRLNNQVEKVILNNLKKDLVLELDNLDSHKKLQNIWINSGTEILKNYDSNDGFLVDDELLASINDLMIRSAFLPTKPTYQTIENTGKIDLISNKNLKEEILIYYKDISWFSKNTTDNNTYLVDQLVNNRLIEHTFFQTETFSKELREESTVFDIENYKLQKSNRFIEQVQKELNSLDKSLNLINVVSFRMFLANLQIDFAQKSESDTRNLIKSLEIELNK